MYLPIGKEKGEKHVQSRRELAIVDLALASIPTATTIAATAAMPSTFTTFILATPLFKDG